ncbi:hypothetical protein TWF106_011399 [Orbilia oligospora]|uniref:Uncharacterized protein n=1 Tax=Orbilia oligospora TaxID=2813651 RepID=A0A7C8QFM1_ORBOL|nr:hypothetical protein TWF788_010297 [Orbilia oligospora]KAF3197969.1 hypothetical protein TWF679_002463 [Orbilia oligospora]KAF3208503.1 hypothetical protein TWF106_011399 [Orbilia oligospora]
MPLTIPTSLPTVTLSLSDSNFTPLFSNIHVNYSSGSIWRRKYEGCERALLSSLCNRSYLTSATPPTGLKLTVKPPIGSPFYALTVNQHFPCSIVLVPSGPTATLP